MKWRAAMLALALLAIMHNAHAARGQADAYSMRLGQLINDYRAQHALQPLALNAALSDLAREHAMRMAREERLSHDDFQQRFTKAHSPTCVENVGANHGAPEAEFEAWRNSPAHDRNLLDSRIARMGIAIENAYVTFFACR